MKHSLLAAVIIVLLVHTAEAQSRDTKTGPPTRFRIAIGYEYAGSKTYSDGSVRSTYIGDTPGAVMVVRDGQTETTRTLNVHQVENIITTAYPKPMPLSFMDYFMELYSGNIGHYPIDKNTDCAVGVLVNIELSDSVSTPLFL